MARTCLDTSSNGSTFAFHIRQITRRMKLTSTQVIPATRRSHEGGATIQPELSVAPRRSAVATGAGGGTDHLLPEVADVVRGEAQRGDRSRRGRSREAEQRSELSEVVPDPELGQGLGGAVGQPADDLDA